MKQFGYVIHHKNIISKLKEEHGKLKGVKEAMQAWVDTKKMNREGIEPNIQNWLNDMEAFENVLQRTFSEEEVKKNEKCFGGKCPNLANNYSLGKRAAKGIEYIARLKEEKKEFQFISYHKPPPTVGSTFTEGIKSLKSRMMIMNQVIEKLKDDKLKRISICGMGGVGKTTLAKELIKYVENNKLFDKVVMAVVSQNPDYKNIQNQIADCLGMSLRSKSVEGRGREIIQKLKEIDDDGKTKVLVVLDDVWSELNFDKVGLPSRDDQKCIKIIFTSRHEKECQKMGSQMNFDVSVLVEDEAWYLFQAITGDVVYEPDIYPIAKQVSRECRDLPLAIVIVGKALKNEKKLSTWEVALEQLKNSQSSTLSDVHKFVYSRIELSLNFLGSIHKKFLMLCGLFPEDFDIPIESLSRHATGLGLFKVDGDTWKTINQVHHLVDDLKRCCLLLDSNVPGCVKMHDIVRDVVILVTFKTDEHRQFMVEYDMKRLREEKLDDINAISLILDDETIGLEDKLECPTLQLLQLQSKRKEPTQWPKSFFLGMKSLKVLSLQSLYIPKFSTLSQASVSLHTLQVEYCDVGDISIIGKELIHLKVLSFAHSNIKELPIEIGNLSVLRLLDLTNCNDLNVISANVLIRLSQLKELYLWMDNFPWIKNDVAMNELKQISHQLKVVEMKVREVEFLVMDLDLYNLQKFWIFVDPYTRFRRSAYLESNLLQVSAIDYQFVNRIMIVSHLIKKCEILAIRNMKDLKNVMTQLLCDCPSPYLKVLRVDSCPDLVFLIDTTVYCNGFPNIRSLSLKNLPNFKEMCYASNNGELNSPHWMQLFPKLETILLQDCSSINVVFDTHVNGQVFPQLKEIEIAGLHQLTHVWRSNKAMHCVQGFQNLKILTISY
ncbi:putative disease resistance protein [Trifolium repens]|nr:putative disease resistance protein [Trifolium repens]